jgi:hypothetical protein
MMRKRGRGDFIVVKDIIRCHNIVVSHYYFTHAQTTKHIPWKRRDTPSKQHTHLENNEPLSL